MDAVRRWPVREVALPASERDSQFVLEPWSARWRQF